MLCTRRACPSHDVALAPASHMQGTASVFHAPDAPAPRATARRQPASRPTGRERRAAAVRHALAMTTVLEGVDAQRLGSSQEGEKRCRGDRPVAPTQRRAVLGWNVGLWMAYRGSLAERCNPSETCVALCRAVGGHHRRSGCQVTGDLVPTGDLVQAGGYLRAGYILGQGTAQAEAATLW